MCVTILVFLVDKYPNICESYEFETFLHKCHHEVVFLWDVRRRSFTSPFEKELNGCSTNSKTWLYYYFSCFFFIYSKYKKKGVKTEKKNIVCVFCYLFRKKLFLVNHPIWKIVISCKALKGDIYLMKALFIFTVMK